MSDDRGTWPTLSIEEVVAIARHGYCPICGHGPMRNVAQHFRHRHGCHSSDVKAHYGLNRTESFAVQDLRDEWSRLRALAIADGSRRERMLAGLKESAGRSHHPPIRDQARVTAVRNLTEFARPAALDWMRTHPDTAQAIRARATSAAAKANTGKRDGSVMLPCGQCGVLFRVWRSRVGRRKYCSLMCSNEARRGAVKLCGTCGRALSGSQRKYCSMACYNVARPKGRER